MAATFLTSLFTASLVSANLLGSKLVDVFGVTVSLGIFVFPFTFIAADIVTEVYGKPAAQNMVKAGIAIQVYVLAFVFLGSFLPDSHTRSVGDAYRVMFGLAPRMVVASITAYSFSQFFEIWIFARLKQRFLGTRLLLRTNLATWTAQLFDTAIFMGIFLGGVLSIEAWMKSFVAAYFSKMIVATFDSPFVNLGVWLVHRVEKNREQ
jgi:uncharacterized integral membrane protein (TIGR00697 family)